jgi:hypothetical protein
MVPAYPSLIAARAELDAVARPLAAYTYGWGTSAGGEQYTMTEPEPAPPKPQLRWCQYSLRSLFTGGLVAVPLLFFGTPHLLAAYCQHVYFHAASFFRLIEPLAIVASTIYVVNRFTRRTVRWQFSLKELLTVVTALCLATSITANQSTYARSLAESVARALEEMARKSPDLIVCGTFVYYPPYPLLSVEYWYLRLPLLFGVACLAYLVVKVAFWGVRKANWWITQLTSRTKT